MILGCERDALEHAGYGEPAGISVSSVHRVWRAFSLQPHHVETFKLSKDAPFIEKVQVIVGFIMTRPIRR